MTAQLHLQAASRRFLVAMIGLALLAAALVAVPSTAQAACTGNVVVCENEQLGTDREIWDVDGRGDDSIQGFATRISVNVGSPVQFKIDTDSRDYSISIYRLGYYQGKGARLVDTIRPSAPLPQNQVACATNDATQVYDCGTWAVSATWNVPTSAVSGVYIAHLVRADGSRGSSHIPFIVRKDGNTSQVLFQTSDPTWQAYNTYGGSNFYYGGPNGRSFKASYNRPFSTRDVGAGRDFLFSNEYPTIRYLEQNGFDVSYVSGQDTSVDPALIPKHKVFLSVGHDEYWSADQRKNVENARDAKVNLAFFGGNNVYWKTRWEPSQDGSATPNRTLVCYKDTWANKDNGPVTALDPVTPTATWRDPRFGDLGGGPENSLLGTQYQANSVDLAIKVSAEEGKLRLWRSTSLASLPAGDTATLAAHTVGYESDEDVDNGFRPAGLMRLSTTTGPTAELLTDFGNTVVAGTTTHHLTQYRAPSGALVFSSGSVQWAWGLDSNHDGLDIQPPDPRIRQATLNLLADMGAQATTRAGDLAPAVQTTDTTAPTSTITSPASGSSVGAGDLVTVTGTASDVGGTVAAVEVSVDGGATFHAAEGRRGFRYTSVQTGTGPDAIQVRAVDDSGNIQTTPTRVAVTTSCPCSVFGAMTPTTTAIADGGAMTLGTKIVPAADGFISGIRFYKGSGNTGTHTATLYDSSGATLATATFANETAAGWQTANFPSAVPVQGGATYLASYYAPNGHYAADSLFFSYRGYSSGRLSTPGGNSTANGVFAYNSQRPGDSFRQTNYYVDAVWSPTDTTPLAVTTTTPPAEATSVPVTSSIAATFTRSVTPSSLGFTVVDGDDVAVPGTTTYDDATRTATFNPAQSLTSATRYTVYVTGVATSGGGMPAPHQWSFTSARAPSPDGVCPCTVFDDGDHPTNPPETETSTLQLGMAFTSSEAGTISGIRFYKGPGNGGAHTVSLYDRTGRRLATAPVLSESTTGWQQADFDAPVAVAAGATYIASYLAPQGRYSAAGGGLAAKITRGPLSTLANGGRYVYSSTGAPLNASSANYFVDPVFNVAPGQPPEVVDSSPGTGATSVPVSAQVTAVFNGSIQPGTAQIAVKRSADGQPVTGNMANETAGTTASFTPAGPLDAGTRYTVTVTGAASAAGTAMTTPFTSTFTTSGAAACPCSLMDTSTTPALSDSGDTSAVTLGLTFSPTVSGFVKGLRYYRDAANTGTHTGRLWGPDGAEIASLTFVDRDPGWQTATFAAPVPVVAGRSYTAGYYAPRGHYSAANGYFNAPVTNVPLVAPVDGGVYALGDNRPVQSYLSSNYYVDVVFTTADDDPPVVTTVAPAAGAAAVPADSSVTAVFDRAITESSLAVTVADAAGQLIGGQVSYDETSRRATFLPAAPLVAGSTYTASAAADSSSGVSMPRARTWTFSTASTTPTVTGVTPADAAVNVPPASTVTATFTGDVAPASVALTLRTPAGVAVGGTTTYDAAARRAVFTPAAPLTGYTRYTATATASTPSGVAMAAPRSWSFTTADPTAPTTTSTSPAAGATGVAVTAAVTATFARDVDPASVQVRVTRAGVVVAGATSYSASRVATFTPSSALAGATTYTVSVTANNTSGVPMAAPRTWSFTTADVDPPVLTGRSPADGTAGVAATTTVTATFARAITTGSATLTLRTAAGASVAGTTTYSTTTRTVTFRPTAALTSSTTYTASVSARSATGVVMPAAATWSFTTAAQSVSLYATTRLPSATSASSVPTTLGVSFSSSRAGQVTAIRYYASSLNTGRTVKLWNANGTSVLATASTAQTGTGWRTATFTTPVAITAGTSYVASYHAPVGRWSTTSSGYGSTYASGPLSVPVSGGRTANGDVFPANPSSTNFWVDVLVLV